MPFLLSSSQLISHPRVVAVVTAILLLVTYLLAVHRRAADDLSSELWEHVVGLCRSDLAKELVTFLMKELIRVSIYGLCPCAVLRAPHVDR